MRRDLWIIFWFLKRAHMNLSGQSHSHSQSHTGKWNAREATTKKNEKRFELLFCVREFWVLGSVRFVFFIAVWLMLLVYIFIMESPRQSHKDTYYTFLWQLYRFPVIFRLGLRSNFFCFGWRVHVRCVKVDESGGRKKRTENENEWGKKTKWWTNKEFCQGDRNVVI